MSIRGAFRLASLLIQTCRGPGTTRDARLRAAAIVAYLADVLEALDEHAADDDVAEGTA